MDFKVRISDGGWHEKFQLLGYAIISNRTHHKNGALSQVGFVVCKLIAAIKQVRVKIYREGILMLYIFAQSTGNSIILLTGL